MWWIVLAKFAAEGILLFVIFVSKGSVSTTLGTLDSREGADFAVALFPRN